MLDKKNRGLGRGLSALLDDTTTNSSTLTANVLAINQLRPGKYQPRQVLNEAALETLALSIRQQGMLQPIVVRAIADSHTTQTMYEIIAGERRFRAAQKAGLTEVPVLIRNVSDKEALAIALIENLQREDLNPIEEAQGIARLIRDFQLTHEQAAETVGRSRSAVSNLLRLLDLAAPVQKLLIEKKLDYGHARTLLTLSKADQIKNAQSIIQKQLSVREAEKLQKPQNARQNANSRQSADLHALQQALADHLGATVSIKLNTDGKQGVLQIHFYSLQELQGLLKKMGFKPEL